MLSVYSVAYCILGHQNPLVKIRLGCACSETHGFGLIKIRRFKQKNAELAETALCVFLLPLNDRRSEGTIAKGLNDDYFLPSGSVGVAARGILIKSSDDTVFTSVLERALFLWGGLQICVCTSFRLSINKLLPGIRFACFFASVAATEI